MDAVSTNLRRAQKKWGSLFRLRDPADRGPGVQHFPAGAPEHLYLQVIYAFNPDVPIVYILAILQIGVTIFHWLPLALYIFERPLGPRWVWKAMFVLRVILDVAGNSYAKNVLVSLYQNDPWVCVLTLLYLALPYVPWYWACWRYAFVFRLKPKGIG